MAILAKALGTSVTTNHPQPRRTFQCLQAGRGLAAFMVVLYHAERTFSLSKYWGVKTHVFFFGASGVDFFFVLSGIVILHAHWSDIGVRAAVRGYAWKRFRRIYPIYWVVLAAMLIVFFSVPSFGNGYEKQPAVILGSALLLPITQVLTVVPVAWTLFHEIMFYIVFGVLIFSRRIGLSLLALWMLWSLASLIWPSNGGVVGMYGSPLHLLFGLGLVVLCVVNRFSLRGELLAASGVAGVCVCCAYENSTQSSTIAGPLLIGVSYALAATGMMLMEKKEQIKIPRYLVLMGNASYSVYLVHYVLLSAISKVLYPLSLRMHIPTLVAFVVAVCVAVAGGLAVHLLVEVPLLIRLPKRMEVRSRG